MSAITRLECPSTPQQPRWDRDGGIWFASPTVPKEGPTPMCRWYPTVNSICEPLMGSSVRYQAGDKIRFVAHYPRLERSLHIYREALRLVEVLGSRSELFMLAVYRRQVTEEGDIDLDEHFLRLADSFNLTPEEWFMLVARMPRRSRVRRLCLKRAWQPSQEEPPLAAE